jgi:hypothetical protein
MRKILITLSFILFFVGQSFAQIDSVFTKTIYRGNLPTWFSQGANLNFERGFGYSPIKNAIYVPSRNGGTFVRAMDATTGDDLAALSTNGMSGGTYVINVAEAAIDAPVLYACNLVTSAGSVFKIYRWDLNNTADPTIAFELPTATALRYGDGFTLVGKLLDNTAKIFLPEKTLGKVYILGTANQGVTFAIQDSIQLPATVFGGAISVFPVYKNGLLDGIMTKSSGKNLQLYSVAGVLMQEVPSTIVPTGATSIKGFEFNHNYYVAIYQYGGSGENLRIICPSDQGFHTRTYAITPTVGNVANLNGTGDVDFFINPNGTIDLFLLATNNGIGRYKMSFPFLVNGRFNEPYTQIANKMNQNSGFGANMDINSIGYAFDSNFVYIAVGGKLDKTNSNGIAVLLNFSNINGLAAGQSLGGVTGGGHLFGDATNPNWKMGFEVDLGFVINAGGNDSVSYLDAGKYFNGVKTGGYIGSSYNSGTSSTGPSVAGIFAANAITFAYDSAYGNSRGLEIRIPKSELNNLGFSGTLQAAAFIVSNTAYFSDVTVPGNLIGGNAAFNPNFGTLAGGPYYSGNNPLPVEFVSFSANTSGNSVSLNWSTATETNNKGFAVEKSFDGTNFTEIGFVVGKGNSTAINHYSYSEINSGSTSAYYRLKQVDFDGTTAYSSMIKVEFEAVPNVFALNQNYPNPFNPSTVISFTVAEEGVANLRVYNISGELVASLFNENAKTGQNYNIQFNASNLPSGIYFYRLTQGNNIVTKKLTLLK